MTKDSGDSSKNEFSTTSTPQFQCLMLKPLNYSLWAIRMKIILEANGLWEAIEPNEKTQADNRKDKTVITFLYQALPEDQLLQITKHKTAKAIWDTLKTRHIGEESVQQARLQTLKFDFEMLHMKEDETIDTFTEKLTTLVNKAASLGHTMEDETLVRKLLNAVPNRFLQIVASIEQYSDLDTMSLDEAIGRPETFEERLKYKNERLVNTQERLLFTRHEDQCQQFRRCGHGGFNQSRGQENNKFRLKKKSWESSQNNFKKETNINSNKFTHDKSKKQPEKYDQPGLKEDHNNEGGSNQKEYDQPGLKEDHNNESGSNHKNMINMDIMKITTVNLEVASKKGKEKLEHFGVKLEEEKEYHDRKFFHPMQPNKRSIQYNNIKIKEEETSSTSSETGRKRDDESVAGLRFQTTFLLTILSLHLCLSTLRFFKFPENSFEVLKLLENSVEVLKIPENKLELMKIQENKLESLKL
uniref:Zinc finger, CCHC-type n=1 Tax=Tanacetum cinerariifolium TaxID=118510 RepID=A0A6L2JZ68_TANCI|nr:zinc finger, CCHC-type [Tanacetum cinerariifolium]